MAKPYLAEARRRWPKAIWIIGAGPYASVSMCHPGGTVMLYETLAEAEIAKRLIDHTACGGGCIRAHAIVDLRPKNTPRIERADHAAERLGLVKRRA